MSEAIKAPVHVLYQFPDAAGDKFQPSNGTEGMVFDEVFCERCWYDAKYRRTQDGRDGCEILCSVMAYDIKDDRYPNEWVYDGDGWPTCTAFREKKP